MIIQKNDIFLCFEVNSNANSEEHNIIKNCKMKSYEDSRILIGKNKQNIYVSSIQYTQSFLDKYWKPIHIYSSIAGWSGCTFLGIIAAHYFKHRKEWILVHQIVVGGNSVFTLITGLIGLIISIF